MKPQTPQEELIVRLGLDPLLAHQALFLHRHPQATPEFHREIIADLHGPHPRVLELAFRGAAKSTIAEEYICVAACYRRFRNFIIVCESYPRAVERLKAIAHELEYNEHIATLFGNMMGPTWNEDKIELSNGVVIQAFGRGQSLRGTKHNDARPDGCLIDDIEDAESVASPEQRDKTEVWLMRTLLPAMAPGARVRMLANMLDPDCLAVRLRKTGTWLVREYPWEYISPRGERVATWDTRFPLNEIDRTKREFERLGRLNEYQQEFMVQAIDPSTRVFRSDMFKVEATVRTWQPSYAMYDPARTVKQTSDYTGKVVFSWVGSRLIVWEADGQRWLPDQIIADMFEVHDKYSPIKIGIEKEGLEEFILQPLRQEQTRRRQILPVEVMPAPVGKLDFIRSLQPFFASGEVIFAKELPMLVEQLLSFPTGYIDVPNALAYALRMRPGLPIYENFSPRHVDERLPLVRSTTTYLALGATRQYTTGVLAQLANGQLRVIADWVKEGDPGSTIDDIVLDARLLAGGSVSVFAPPEHWRPIDPIGLQPAARKANVRLKMGGEPGIGRAEIRRRLEAQTHGLPALLVSSTARWTLNALSGGYARMITKGKMPMATADAMADEGVYKVLMEGFESFAAVAAGALTRDGDDEPNYAIDARGRKYLSARATHHSG